MSTPVCTRSSSRRPLRLDEDRGAGLIIAIGFVVMIGAMTAGLSSLVVSSMTNRGSLQAVRDRQYAADGAVEDAIVAVRALDRSTTGSCTAAAGSAVSTTNSIAIRVDWQNLCGAVIAPDGTVVSQRNVVFTACADTGKVCGDSQVIIRAQVNFEQSESGAVSKTYVQSWNVNQ